MIRALSAKVNEIGRLPTGLIGGGAALLVATKVGELAALYAGRPLSEAAFCTGILTGSTLAVAGLGVLTWRS